MNQNRLYVLVGALLVVVAAMAIYIWQEERKPDGIEIQLGKDGISVQEN